MPSAIGRSAVYTTVTLVIVVLAWQAVISFSGISTHVGKGPADVWRFLVVTEEGARSTAAENRAELFPLLWESFARCRAGIRRRNRHRGGAVDRVLALARRSSRG